MSVTGRIIRHTEDGDTWYTLHNIHFLEDGTEVVSPEGTRINDGLYDIVEGYAIMVPAKIETDDTGEEIER